MPLTSRHIVGIASTLTAAALLAGCSSDKPQPTTPPSAAATIPAGVEGAAHFDDGYLQIGSGPKTVDLYIDPMCPYCKLFEETSGPMLFAAASNQDATIRIHPVAILDRLSKGTAYSTRAASFLTAVAAKHPDKTQAFLQALYAHQPAEETAGLTDKQLRDLAHGAGVPSADQLDSEQYRRWVQRLTARAMFGPLPTTTQIPAIHGVPTVVVDGDVFHGNSDETDAFKQFYASH
ncbi:thioredoxin domain-containing protein [Curtobacterium sp. Csp1]|uniref:DsbA family protein n=1 Tax=Curtobacterium sp. Csp1 TaxID=2495429 RepID=UPI00159AF847|nr:thioredoxin domain-containing protein [Curtobacterium sp. Csp1]QKS18845.1 thioredoxin domain-containing protein [Curtobacterium sp. Csp1]